MDINKEYLLWVAEQYYLNREFLLAENVLEKIIKHDHNNSRANELLAYIFAKRDDFNTTLQLLKKATSQENCSAESFYYLGSCFLKKNDLKQALEAFKKSLEKAGDFFEGLHDAGIACSGLGMTKDALEYYKRAFKYKKTPELYFNIASIYDVLNDYGEAIKNYGESIKLDPSNYQAWLNKGVSLKNNGQYQEALQHLNQAIELKPDYFKAWGNKAALLDFTKRYHEALECYEEALRINPDYVEAWSNMGLTLNHLKKSDKAIESINKAIKINPQYLEAWLCKAIVLHDLRRFEEAVECCNTALKIDPNHRETIYNKSLINLSNKFFETGFFDYEARFKRINFSYKFSTESVSVWDGSGSNLRLLIIGEQGLGDEIFYSRFLNNHKENNQITAIIDKRLVSIFSRSFSNVRFVTKESNLEKTDFDRQIAMGSLAKLSIKNITDINQSNKNFLAPQPVADKQFNKNNKFTCGISWKSTNKEIGESKSIDLINLKKVLKIPKCEFINLQYGDVQEEINFVSNFLKTPIRQINGLDLFNDIDGLLSLIQSCNIVITTCNLTAHLAGAIGKKTLLLTPYAQGKIWYWHHDKTSIWYPSIKQYFQEANLTWNNAIEEVFKELEFEIAKHN